MEQKERGNVLEQYSDSLREADAVILVEGTGGSEATLRLYERRGEYEQGAGAARQESGAERESGAWRQSGAEPCGTGQESGARQEGDGWRELFSQRAFVGRCGIGAVHSEGDCVTPRGVYRFLFAFGTEENPGARLEYRQITPYSYYVDDVRSVWYNKWVEADAAERKGDAPPWLARVPHVPRSVFGSAEHLCEIVPQYCYGAALNQNEDCVPNKGSAIFLHCTGEKPYTAGCVAVPRETMAALLRRMTARTRMVIL